MDVEVVVFLVGGFVLCALFMILVISGCNKG